MWKRLYAYFTLNEESFNILYHRRSNVETTFSMVKGQVRRLGSVQVRDRPNQRNSFEGSLS